MFSESSCKNKVKQLVTRGMTPKDAKHRVEMGCNTHKLHAQTEEFEYWRCTCKFHNPMVPYLLQCANYVKQGILPFEGGLLDQPAILMEAITVVQNFLHEEEERHRKKQEAANKAKRK